MPEQIVEPEELEESTFSKYKPLIKSLAALGTGLAGGKGVGFSKGLTSQNRGSIQRNLLAQDIRRKQTEAQIKATQAKNKQQLDMIWKVASQIDNDDAMLKFLVSTGFDELANIALPESLGDETDPVDLIAVDTAIESIEDDVQRDTAKMYASMAKKFGIDGDLVQMKLSIDKAIAYTNGSVNKPFFSDDGKTVVYAPNMAEAVQQYGIEYANKTKPKTAVPKEDSVVKGKYRDLNSITGSYRSEARQGYLQDPLEQWNVMGDNARGLMMMDDFDIHTASPIGSPYPGYISGIYDIVAFSEMLNIDINAGAIDSDISGDEVFELLKTPQMQNRINERSATLQGVNVVEPKKKKPSNIKMSQDDNDQLAWLKEQKSLPVSQRSQAYKGALEDLKSRFPSVKI
jgi:hypothetical protein